MQDEPLNQVVYQSPGGAHLHKQATFRGISSVQGCILRLGQNQTQMIAACKRKLAFWARPLTSIPAHLISF